MLTRRQFFLLVWAISLFLSGYLVAVGSGNLYFGFATSLGILGVSLEVPLMRALTEFSK